MTDNMCSLKTKYTFEKESASLFPVLQLPVLIVSCGVILWNYSVVAGFLASLIVLAGTVTAFVTAWNTVIKEELLVVSTLGIQFQQTNILGKTKYTKFVPIENIKTVVINEVIMKQRVIAYLLIILETAESSGQTMVPLLIGTLPRLRTIETIYFQLQRTMLFLEPPRPPR